MSNGYDDELSAEVNQARALFEIAAALRDLRDGLHHTQSLSIAEAIEIAGKHVAEGIVTAASRER